MTLSVLFVDVRGFTALSERLPPADLVDRLNRFYDLATQVVFAEDGTLDKMVGDQVMAFLVRLTRSMTTHNAPFALLWRL